MPARPSPAAPRPACPCGSGTPYDGCCGPLHRGTSTAATPEQLMRSRYSAFAVGDADYLRATWHPRTRPRELDLEPGLRWVRLEVLEAGGGLFGTSGTVRFRAHWRRGGERGELLERSAFVREGGRWLYVGPAPAG